MDKTKIIVTGVTGMDGSHMVDYLLENTKDCTIIYGLVRRHSNTNYKNIQHVLNHPRFKIISCDITDSTTLASIIKDLQPNYFINFAAQSHVQESWKNPVSTFISDGLGVLYILEGIRQHAPQCRFYNAGTSEEWGNVDYSPQDEKHPLKPRSPYAAAKVAARALIKVYRESYNLYAIQGWLTNHESTRRSPDFVTRKITLGVAKIVHELKNKKPITPIILGNLNSYRDWSHSKDFMDGIWKMLNQEWLLKDFDFSKRYSEQINSYVLSSGETHSIREFIERAFDIAGINIVNVNLKSQEPEKDELQVNYTLLDGTPVILVSREFYRPAEVDLLLGCSDKIKNELGWKQKHSFVDLVKEMVVYDIENYGK